MNKLIRCLLALVVLFVAGAGELASNTISGASAAALAPIPGGFPGHFGYGLFNGNISTMHPGIPYDYRYQYLAGGVNTGEGWQTWGTNYAANYVAQSRQRGYIPGFVYYMILQSGPNYDEYSNLNNTSTMRDYYNDFKVLLQQMNDGQPAFINIEPDLDGVMMQHSSNTSDNAALQPTRVGSTGVSELAGMADNFRNYWQALVRLRDLYAPNVVLGQDLSLWGADYDLTIALRNDPGYDWQGHADRTAAYHNSFGPGYALNFYSPLDRDAAFYQINYGSDRWWHDSAQQPSFNTMAAWLGRVNLVTNKRALMWQVPNGNQRYRTENNTSGHYQDNRPEYFLNSSTGRSHMSLWADQGVIGLMFGAGTGSQSHYFDSNGDGVTNPAPINGNDLVATVADDDGGYIRLNVAAYYNGGVLPLPGGTAGTPTPVPTTTSAVATSTPVNTATRTPTPTRTATRTSTPRPSATSVAPSATMTPIPLTRTATSTAGQPTSTRTPTRTPTRTATATATPAGIGSPVYGDALQNGWENWSWRTNVNFSNTAYAHGGTRSMRVKYTAAWAGLQLGHGGFNTSGYDYLTFWINGGANSGQQMDIYLADIDGNFLTAHPLDNYINGGQVAQNAWRQVTVPLADLGASSRVITAIVLQDTTGSAQPYYYIDDVQFVRGN